MIKFGKTIVKLKIPILIISILLLIPSIFGMVNTRINYDMLTYLPESMDTVKGQDILLQDFGKGAFSLVVVDKMEPNDVAKLQDKFKKIKHVDTVLWYNSLADVTVPMDLLPKKFYDVFNKKDSTMLAVFFDSSTSADETIHAIQQIRNVSGKQCFVSGMSAMVTDLKELCENEEPIYIALAVLFACVAMMLFMDSWIIPLIFLSSIGLAIMWNLGSNYFMGEISYITKALSAVLQLAVTMDYSIFLWHSYSENKERFPGDNNRAMAHAISNTITSIVGSSITTVAGFIALCFMSFTLGKDLGIVMAKGVIFGVVGCVTTLPSLILLLDKAIEKTKHKSLIPSMDKISSFITRRSWIFVLVFLIILGPAYYGYKNADTYYDLTKTLPSDMKFAIANSKLEKDFDMATTHMILCDSKLSSKDANGMLNDIEKVDGVKFAVGFNSLIGSSVPEEVLPDKLVDVLKSNKYQLMLVSSQYKVASNKCNDQITDINSIIKKYDKGGKLIGEAACTKDMIKITDKDFKVVSAISIVAIFLIILVVLKSISLPFILVAVIEFAIFINLGIPYYTGTQMPFITPICISTIQLGATVDYAILMTTRYKKERYNGNSKRNSIITALSTSIPSILVSAFGFFSATFAVGVYSDVDMIKSMCLLMSRGAIISMLSVVFILPAMFVIFDKVIIHTSIGFINKGAVKNDMSEPKIKIKAN